MWYATKSIAELWVTLLVTTLLVLVRHLALCTFALLLARYGTKRWIRWLQTKCCDTIRHITEMHRHVSGQNRWKLPAMLAVAGNAAAPVKHDGTSTALAVAFPLFVCTASAAANYQNSENCQIAGLGRGVPLSLCKCISQKLQRCWLTACLPVSYL